MELTATRGRIGLLLLGLIGIFVMICGGILIGLYDPIVTFFLEKELVLTPGNEFYDIWKELPIPASQKIYLFNITNPEAFEKYGAQPIVQEIGPYVFRGRWRKDNITFDNEDGTVTYKDVKEYTFAPELSVGTQEEKIYTLNGPLLAVINYVEAYSPYLLKPIVVQIVNGIFEAYNESLLVHKTVRELVYDGYHEPMVEDLMKMVEPFITLPLKLINNTFGILHERKHIGDGVYTINSGLKGFDNYTTIAKWNNRSSVNWWNGYHCNQINGTDGAQYRPGLTRDDVLYFFNPNLCRSNELRFEKDITVHGIKTYRYSLPSDSFASPAINPDNKCFCNGRKCLMSGLLPLNCKKGAPYVLSKPHFFEADPVLQTSVVGVDPVAEKHKTFFDIEPTTGIVLNGAVKLQLNGNVKKLRDYLPLKNVEESIVPVLWMSEGGTLDAHFANYFKSRVQTPLVVFKALSIAAVALGALWAVSAAFVVLCLKAKVKPIAMKNSFVMKSLQSVYTSVALWPPTDEEIKEANMSYKPPHPQAPSS